VPVSWLRVGCAAWTCQPPTPTPPSAAARSALERPPTYPHLRKNSAACGGVYLPTPLGSEGKSVSLGILVLQVPLEKECSPARPGPTDSSAAAVRHLVLRAGSMDGVAAAVAAGWPYTSWPITFVACSGGLKNILYSFGTGYGLSMAGNAAVAGRWSLRRLAAPQHWASLGVGCTVATGYD